MYTCFRLLPLLFLLFLFLSLSFTPTHARARSCTHRIHLAFYPKHYLLTLVYFVYQYASVRNKTKQVKCVLTTLWRTASYSSKFTLIPCISCFCLLLFLVYDYYVILQWINLVTLHFLYSGLWKCYYWLKEYRILKYCVQVWTY